MGDAKDQEKVKLALLNCSIGATTPGGSLTVVTVLRPKAVFSMGTCRSLSLDKVRMEDVISSKLNNFTGIQNSCQPTS